MWLGSLDGPGSAFDTSFCLLAAVPFLLRKGIVQTQRTQRELNHECRKQEKNRMEPCQYNGTSTDGCTNKAQSRRLDDGSCSSCRCVLPQCRNNTEHIGEEGYGHENLDEWERWYWLDFGADFIVDPPAWKSEKNTNGRKCKNGASYTEFHVGKSFQREKPGMTYRRPEKSTWLRYRSARSRIPSGSLGSSSLANAEESPLQIQASLLFERTQRPKKLARICKSVSEGCVIRGVKSSNPPGRSAEGGCGS